MLLELKPSTTAPDLHSCSYLYLTDKYVMLSISLYTANFFSHFFFSDKNKGEKVPSRGWHQLIFVCILNFWDTPLLPWICCFILLFSYLLDSKKKKKKEGEYITCQVYTFPWYTWASFLLCKVGEERSCRISSQIRLLHCRRISQLFSS